MRVFVVSQSARQRRRYHFTDLL